MHTDPEASHGDAHFWRGLARAYTGAVLFALPLFMTMEMWWLGFIAEPARLALFLLIFFPLLVVLSWHAGFEATFSWKNDIVDALVAFWVGISSSAAVLLLLGVLGASSSADEVVGTLAITAVPGSIGALLAQSMLGEQRAQGASGPGSRYLSELFIMAIGALFLAFNLAPTDEIPKIAERLASWQVLLLVGVSMVVMHGFVYAVSFKGTPENPYDHPQWSLFLRFTVVGYVVALGFSAYLLWTFGRLEGLGLLPALEVTMVLAFPASFGAAAARLVL